MKAWRFTPWLSSRAALLRSHGANPFASATRAAAPHHSERLLIPSSSLTEGKVER